MTHADPTPKRLEFVEEDRDDIITALYMQAAALERESRRTDFALETAEHYAHKVARLRVLAGRLRNEQLYSGTVGTAVL